MTALLWIVLGPPAAIVITFVAGRLLGARRGWLPLTISGAAGFTAGTLAAGELTGWAWDSIDMALLAVALATLFTMAIALVIDLVAPVGSLARGEAAGVISLRNPVGSVSRSIAPLRRYRELVKLARRNGVIGGHLTEEELPDGVRRTLEDAGGIFVKMGQIASTRSDVLPKAWCDELSELRSGAEPHPESVMRPHIAAELGADPAELFAEFDWTPIASASISQIYRARLRDGSDVVVKVQRPGLEQTLERDSAAVMQLARLVERRTALGLSMRPADLAREFLDNVAEELDFRIEAANGAELADGLALIDGVRLPRIHDDLSGERILTEEMVTAQTVGEWAAADHTPEERAELADRLITIFLHQIFGVGVFHADPHPGNIMIDADGTIVLIDLGAVGRLGAGHRTAILSMMSAAATGNATGLRQALATITTFGRRVSIPELDTELEEFLARHMRAGRGIDATAFQDLAVLVGRFGIRLPRWFGTLSRTLVTLEGTLTDLDPEFSLVDAARRHADGVGMMPEGGFRAAFEHEAMVQMPRLRRLPERVDELLGQATSGRLSARVTLFADERDERLVTRLVDRLVLGMIASAVGIGSVILLGIESGPRLGESITLNEVLGYFGLAASGVLALRVAAGIIRDGET